MSLSEKLGQKVVAENELAASRGVEQESIFTVGPHAIKKVLLKKSEIGTSS